MKKKPDRVIVIGGGAAGMAAAIEAARCGDRVLILERMDRVGKKLLATGNGRCNLMNNRPLPYHGHQPTINAVLTAAGTDMQQAWWREMGLFLREDDGGRIYPVTNQAATVLDTLRFQLEMLGVEVETGAEVQRIIPDRGFTVETAERTYHCDRVIVACGGKAQEKLGSNGSGYALMKSLGHSCTKLKPVLVQLETDTEDLKGLSGIRIKCEITCTHDDWATYRETGEVLFADYGLSGVCIMNASRYVDKGDIIHLRLLSETGLAGFEAIFKELCRRRVQWASLEAEHLLTGLLPARLAMNVMKRAGLHCRGRVIGDISDTELKCLSALLFDFPLAVRGRKSYDSAQVTRGGIPAEEFVPATMASVICPGVHGCGELLDVDGPCGGYNLMFAFASGILAGRNGR